jgi:hypothetical protein
MEIFSRNGGGFTKIQRREEEESKNFFFEKKKQKTFISFRPRWLKQRGLNSKSFFCFFFVHKKEDSSPFGQFRAFMLLPRP